MNHTDRDLRRAVRTALLNAAEGGYDCRGDGTSDETNARQLVDYDDDCGRIALTLAGSRDPGALDQTDEVMERAVALVVPHVAEWRNEDVQS